MDDRLRELERKASTGDEEARHRLFIEHLRLGILNPIDPWRAAYLKQVAQQQAKRFNDATRRRGSKRLTPEQRKVKRQRQRGSWRYR